jgi:uncharacterized membrane protein YfcA
LTSLTALAALALGVPVGLALGLVGGGGSILALPILITVLGLNARAASGASLVIVAANAAIALRGYLPERLVQYRTALAVTTAGLVGSLAGSYLNALVNPRLLTAAFSALMLLVAALMLRRRSPSTAGSPGLTLRRLLAAGTVIGLTTGFFGVGGGFVIVPALVALGLPMREAVPTSLLVIVLNSLVALGARLLTGVPVPVLLAVPMIVGGAVGSTLAVRIAPRLGNRGLTTAFATLILVLATVMAGQAILADNTL